MSRRASSCAILIAAGAMAIMAPHQSCAIDLGDISGVLGGLTSQTGDALGGLSTSIPDALQASGDPFEGYNNTSGGWFTDNTSTQTTYDFSTMDTQVLQNMLGGLLGGSGVPTDPNQPLTEQQIGGLLSRINAMQGDLGTLYSHLSDLTQRLTSGQGSPGTPGGTIDVSEQINRVTSLLSGMNDRYGQVIQQILGGGASPPSSRGLLGRLMDPLRPLLSQVQNNPDGAALGNLVTPELVNMLQQNSQQSRNIFGTLRNVLQSGSPFGNSAGAIGAVLDRIGDIDLNGTLDALDVNSIMSQYRNRFGNLFCRSPCGATAQGEGLDHIARAIARSAAFYAGEAVERLPWFAPYDNGTGVSSAGLTIPSQYNPTGVSSAGVPIPSLYFPTGVSSAGIESLLHSRLNPGNGLSAAGIDGMFGSFTSWLISQIASLDISVLADASSRAGAITGIAARGFETFPSIDPHITAAIAGGAVFDLLNSGVPLPGSSGGFSDVSLQLPLLFDVFDFGIVDGDIIELIVRDKAGIQFQDTFTLIGPPGRQIVPGVSPGIIFIEVTAQNTGTAFPNTGQVNILSAIITGNATQQFSLTTGETGVLQITAAPP